jgi:23S rRNA (cytidine1920-2'-O)/16S rRNA (cytidine1409-2'-O)-methyltransferase
MGQRPPHQKRRFLKYAKKVRLDQLIVDRELVPDLDSAQRYIMAGQVRAGDRVYDKPGLKVSSELILTIRRHTGAPVSHGALKLRRGLDVFPVTVSGKTCLDIGSSTGGFTQVLLQANATGVTALDVGYGLLDWSLRQDPRVTVLERTNFRIAPLTLFPARFALIVTDVSFISLELILPRALQILAEGGDIIALIKPQFEAPPEDVEPGGLVTAPAIHVRVIQRLVELIAASGGYLRGLEPVQRTAHKNVEFISWWRADSSPSAAQEITVFLETWNAGCHPIQACSPAERGPESLRGKAPKT